MDHHRPRSLDQGRQYQQLAVRTWYGAPYRMTYQYHLLYIVFSSFPACEMADSSVITLVVQYYS